MTSGSFSLHKHFLFGAITAFLLSASRHVRGLLCDIFVTLVMYQRCDLPVD